VRRSFNSITFLALFVVAVAIVVVLAATAVELFPDGFEQGSAAYNTGNYVRALEKLVPLAEAGDSRAQLMLGVMYEDGNGVSRDIRQAIEWYRKAADQNNAEAQSFVGIMTRKAKV
jgi:TPR repeat protein